MLFPYAFGQALASGKRNLIKLIEIDVPNYGTVYWALGPTVTIDNRVGPSTYDGRVKSIAPVRESMQLRGATVVPLETSFVVAEGGSDRTVSRLIGTYDLKRAPVRIYFAMDDLPGHGATIDSNYGMHFHFVGLISKWDQNGNEFTFYCRSDDRAFAGIAPRQPVLQSDWPNADTTAQNPYGLYAPIVYGVHNSVGANSQGFISTINVSYTGGAYWYLVSHGWLKQVTAVYMNGAAQGGANWTQSNVTVNGKSFTLVLCTGFTPGRADRITVDCIGLENKGDGTGTCILNPVDQIYHYLANFGFRDWRSGAWFSVKTGKTSWGQFGNTSNPMNPASFTAGANFLHAFKPEGSRRIGGTSTPPSIKSTVDDWLKSHPPMRLCWGVDGKLYMNWLDYRFGPSLTTGRVWKAQDIISVPRVVSTEDDTVESGRVAGQYCLDSTQGKYWQSLDAEDPSSPNPYAVTAAQYPWAASRLT